MKDDDKTVTLINPATGEDLLLNPRKVVTFKCSEELRERINKGR